MAFILSKSIASAVSAGLMMGAVACGSSQQPAESPEGTAATDANEVTAAEASEGEPTAAAAEAKACCKGLNECKAKGGCQTDANVCAGKNECKGKGGCNHHCPK